MRFLLRRYGIPASVLAIVVAGAMMILVPRAGLLASDPPTLPPITCTFTFDDLSRPDERAWVEGVLKANGAEIEEPGIVSKVVTGAREAAVSSSDAPAASASVTYSCTVRDASSLGRIHAALMAGRPGGPQPIFDAGTPTYAMSYTTARMEGGLQAIARFTVSPDAELYVKSPGGEERDASGSIDRATGKVALATTIAKGQNYLLARTKRGGVERFLRIDLYSGASQDIDRSAYGE